MKITQSDIEAVFSKQLEYHGQEKLSARKAKLIKERLKDGYSIPELVKAIIGCHNTPHNLGDNDRRTKYLGIHVSLRDTNVDRFIEVGQEIVDHAYIEKRRQEQRRHRVEAEYAQSREMTPEQRQAELEAFRAERRAVGI